MNQTTFLQSIYPQLVVTAGHKYIYNIEERNMFLSEDKASEVEIIGEAPVLHDVRGMMFANLNGEVFDSHFNNFQKNYDELQELYQQLLVSPEAQTFRGRIADFSHSRLRRPEDWNPDVFVIQHYISNEQYQMCTVLTSTGKIKSLSVGWLENKDERNTLKYLYQEEVRSVKA